MAREQFCGFETGSLSGELSSTGTSTWNVIGSVAIETTKVRSGSYSCKLTPASGANGYVSSASSGSSGAFHRFYWLPETLPSAARMMFGDGTAAAGNLSLVWKTNGAIELREGGVTGTLRGTSTVLVTDTSHWYRIEVRKLVNDWQIKIDGSQEITYLGSSDSSAVAFLFGANDTVAGTYTAYVDDCVSDTVEYPGESSIVMLLPVSDNSAGSWKAGSAGSASSNGALFDGINNRPPAGTASPLAVTAGISNNISGATTPNGDFNMETYASKGILPGSVVKTVVQVICHGEDVSTNSKTGTFKIVSNPDSGTADTVNGASSNLFGPDAGGAVGTWPTNWEMQRGTMVNNPSVTLETAPVARITKTDTGTRAADLCFMGIYVEFVPANPFVGKRSSGLTEAARRAASW